MKSLTPKEAAIILERSAAIHENSYQEGTRWGGRYTKCWYECVQEAGCPEEWLGLLATAAYSGFGELWDWTAEHTKTENAHGQASSGDGNDKKPVIAAGNSDGIRDGE